MTWWHWLGPAWVGVGGGGLTAAKMAIRASRSHDPLKLDYDWPTTIGAGLVMILAGPMLPLFMFALCIQTISQGRIPISNRAWWPARASKFPVPQAPRSPEAAAPLEDHSPETLLCRMIGIRRTMDPRLRRGDAPENWPMFMLWETTEASILDIVEAYCWLCDGGLGTEEALQRVNAAQSRLSMFQIEPTATLRSLIVDRIMLEDPAYIRLGPDVLGEAIRAAEAWSKAKIDRNKIVKPYPPLEWLKAQVDIGEIETKISLPFKDGAIFAVTDGRAEELGATVWLDSKWRRMKLRMVPGDELWTFSSPAKYWQNLGGRMGVALIRSGRPIGHVVTMMN